MSTRDASSAFGTLHEDSLSRVSGPPDTCESTLGNSFIAPVEKTFVKGTSHSAKTAAVSAARSPAGPSALTTLASGCLLYALHRVTRVMSL